MVPPPPPLCDVCFVSNLKAFMLKAPHNLPHVCLSQLQVLYFSFPPLQPDMPNYLRLYRVVANQIHLGFFAVRGNLDHWFNARLNTKK